MRGGQAVLRAGLLAIAAALLPTACTKLNTSGADRCDTHEDCLSGRACVAGRCRAIDDLPDAGSSGPATLNLPDARFQDGVTRPDDVSQPHTTDMRDSGSSGRGGGGGNGGGGGKGGSGGEASELDQDAGEPDDDAGLDLPDAAPVDPCTVWTPSRPEVALWLDAAHGITADQDGHVEQWVDRTVNQHVALPTGEAATWPLLVAQTPTGHPGVQFGLVDGGPAVRRLTIEDHSSLWFAVEDFAIVVVLQHRTQITPETMAAELDIGAVFLKTCDCPPFIGPNLFANDTWPRYVPPAGPTRSTFMFQLVARADYVARSEFTGFNDNQPHVVVARRENEALTVEVDGLPHGTGLASSRLDVSMRGAPVTIGANDHVDIQALEGEIFELVAIKGTPLVDVDQLVTCLKGKYAIP
jgi:hypothetical protein